MEDIRDGTMSKNTGDVLDVNEIWNVHLKPYLESEFSAGRYPVPPFQVEQMDKALQQPAQPTGTLEALVAKWREEAHTQDVYLENNMTGQLRRAADELEAALTAAPEPVLGTCAEGKEPHTECPDCRGKGWKPLEPAASEAVCMCSHPKSKHWDENGHEGCDGERYGLCTCIHFEPAQPAEGGGA